MGVLGQQPFVPRIGQAPELDQRWGHIGRRQHGKSGRTMRCLKQRHGAPKLFDNRMRQRQRPVVGLPAREVEEDRADLAGLA